MGYYLYNYVNKVERIYFYRHVGEHAGDLGSFPTHSGLTDKNFITSRRHEEQTACDNPCVLRIREISQLAADFLELKCQGEG